MYPMFCEVSFIIPSTLEFLSLKTTLLDLVFPANVN